MTVEVPELPDFCWPVDTSCVPDWDSWEVEPGEDAEPPEGVPTYTPEAKARAIALAGQSMRLLTGFRIGGCPITVRPCTQRCGEQTWRSSPSGFGGSTPWFPVNLGGRWLNIGCGHSGGCGCDGIHEVRLYAPAGAVTEVKVDGVVLDPTAYRLDSGARLVRVDGEAWPLCQNMAAPDSEPGTWSVTYTPGLVVDGLGAWAAGLLAGELVKACGGGDCDLPPNVTQIVRNGVSLTLGVGAFPGNKTGIRAVDSWLEAVNPNGLIAPSFAWSPDIARPRVPGPGGTAPGTLDGGGAAGSDNYFSGGTA